MAHYSKNLVLLGDAAVGKTSLIRRFIMNKYDDKYISTIGKKVSKKDMVINLEGDTTHLTLMIWDIIGQTGYKQIQAASFRNAHGALLVADLTRKETLDSLKTYWIPMLLEVTGPVPVIVLGNKADLIDDVEVSKEDLQTVTHDCEEFGTKLPGYLTSAKSGAHVEDAFVNITGQIFMQDIIPKAQSPAKLMRREDVKSVQDIVDHIIADFAEQLGGIEKATPFVKHQLKVTGLDLSRPTEDAIMKFIDRLARVEGAYKDFEEVERNRKDRLGLFQYKLGN